VPNPAADTGKPVPAEGIQFYSAAGFPETDLERYQKAFGSFGKVVSELPQSYHRLTDSMSLTIGEHRWNIVVGRGHSVEHACLFCAELNTLISGDQILPTISSNVSVYPTEPDADPLADWLDSLAMLKSSLPPDVLVLPAHGKPFRGAQVRLDELTAEHMDGLDRLQTACRNRCAIDAFPLLFKAITQNNLIMAAEKPSPISITCKTSVPCAVGSTHIKSAGTNPWDSLPLCLSGLPAFSAKRAPNGHGRGVQGCE
jgi:glyoxylase-like metal-dependent hydrolase (beta-lactamase superfamily II)